MHGLAWVGTSNIAIYFTRPTQLLSHRKVPSTFKLQRVRQDHQEKCHIHMNKELSIQAWTRPNTQVLYKGRVIKAPNAHVRQEALI